MLWLVAAELFLNVARGILNLALGLFLYRTTGQLWLLAVAFTSEFVCALVLQGVAGLMVDRLPPANVLAVGSTLSALLFPLAFAWAALTSSPFESTAAYALFIVLGLNLARPWNNAAEFAVIHQVVSAGGVERLNSYLVVACQAGQLVGMAIGGGFLSVAEPRQAFMVAGALQAVVALAHLIFRFRVRTTGRPVPSDGRARLSSVVRHLRRFPHVLAICSIGMVEAALVGLFNLALAPIVDAHFGGKPIWLTFLDMSFAIGALLGGAFFSLRRRPIGVRLGPTLLGLTAATAAFAAFAWLPSAWLVLPALAVFGFAVTVSTVVWQAALQLAAPLGLKGRLGSLRFQCNSAAVGGATLLASSLHDRGLLTVSGFAVLLGALGTPVVALLYASSREGLASEPSGLEARRPALEG